MTWTTFSCALCSDHVTFKGSLKLQKHLLERHDTEWRTYIINTCYGNTEPKCACGCGCVPAFNSRAGTFNAHIHGHNKVEISPATRAHVGKINSIKMTRLFAENPDIAQARAARMREFVTDETREKRINASRVTTQSSEYRQQTSERFRKFWAEHPDVRAQATNKCHETHRTREAEGRYEALKQHLSKVMVDKLTRGERIWQRGLYVSTGPSAQRCRYKSSYELIAMQELDANTDKITSWRYEPIFIRYTDEHGQPRRYVPDFTIETSMGTFMLEVKPKKMHDRCRLKIEAGFQHCYDHDMTFILWEPCDGPLIDVLIKH